MNTQDPSYMTDLSIPFTAIRATFIPEHGLALVNPGLFRSAKFWVDAVIVCHWG